MAQQINVFYFYFFFARALTLTIGRKLSSIPANSVTSATEDITIRGTRIRQHTEFTCTHIENNRATESAKPRMIRTLTRLRKHTTHTQRSTAQSSSYSCAVSAVFIVIIVDYFCSVHHTKELMHARYLS